MKSQMISKLFFRLLGVQILLALITAVNGIVSGIFASNYIGAAAMSAIGLYNPVNLLVSTIGIVLLGGTQVLCGKSMGKDQVSVTAGIFSLDVILVTIIGLFISAVLLIIPDGMAMLLNAQGEAFTPLRDYLVGTAIGILPLLLSQQLSAFLSLERKSGWTTAATIAFIVANAVLAFLFIDILQMGTFGLALASSIGYWIFTIILVFPYFSHKTVIRFNKSSIQWKDIGSILRIGCPGALSSACQVIRGIFLNNMILDAAGNNGIAALSTCNTVCGLIWALPAGILAVSRLLISISIGEEDRDALKDIFRTVLYKALPLVLLLCTAVALLAAPLTSIYYQDPSSEVFNMTVTVFRFYPFAHPLSTICIVFTALGQAMGRQLFVQILSVTDGIIGTLVFCLILTPLMGVNGIWLTQILNGILTTAVIIAYSWIVRKQFPRNIEELLALPDNFGVSENDRLHIPIYSINDVIRTAESIQDFCLSKGVNEKHSYMAALCMEEMAGNVIDHGFIKDRRKHSADVRVTYLEDGLILCIKDDCIRFDPAERQKIFDPDDICKNIGIRMVYKIAKEITYRSVLGLNVLTIKVF